MTMRDDMLGVVVEGACDRWFGRPLDRNPASAAHAFRVWDFGWKEADFFIDVRGEEKAQRWLRDVAW